MWIDSKPYGVWITVASFKVHQQQPRNGQQHLVRALVKARTLGQPMWARAQGIYIYIHVYICISIVDDKNPAWLEISKTQGCMVEWNI